MNDNKKKALDAALGQIERQFGKGSVMRMGDEDAMARDLDVISTGSLGLDVALGVGGFPKGRVVEIYGPESSGKTTLALQAVAACQKAGGTAAFVDAETTTGGNALKFYASVRLDIRRIGAVKQGDEVVGNETRVKVVKNKVSPPFKQAEFQILYGEGSSLQGEIIDIGTKLGLIDKAGAWYSYQGERIGQGKMNVIQYLKENTEMADAIEAQIRAELLPKTVKGDAAESEVEA